MTIRLGSPFWLLITFGFWRVVAVGASWPSPDLQYNAGFDKVSLLTAHNANANSDSYSGTFDNCDFFSQGYSNQNEDMYEQIVNYGVRGLMIDILVRDGAVRLVHTTHDCADYGLFTERMREEVKRAMDDLPDAVLFLDIERNGDVSEEAMLQAFSEAGLLEYVFDHNHGAWANHKNWPSLNQLLDAGQRLIVQWNANAISLNGQGRIYNKRDISMENMYGETGEDYDDNTECEYAFRGALTTDDIPDWTRLITFNHFDREGAFLSAADQNNWEKVFHHMYWCFLKDEKIPNIIAVDWIGDDSDDPPRIVDFLNHGGVALVKDRTKAVCLVDLPGAGETSTWNGGNGCTNDEATHAWLINVPPGTSIKICDDNDCSTDDDTLAITVKKYSAMKWAGSLEWTNHEDEFIHKTYYEVECGFLDYSCRENGLAGKVSGVQIEREQPDPHCDTGIGVGNACCSSSCGSCGGSGCGGRPGGVDQCCQGSVESSFRSCNYFSPPCRMELDPHCKTGTLSFDRAICCPSSCGFCGGPGCFGDCCYGVVTRTAGSCNDHPPPCVMEPDPQCETGITSESGPDGTACCPSSCPFCGGQGCYGNCCYGVVTRTAGSCNDNPPPCVIEPDPQCETGISSESGPDGTACCPSSCPFCGGPGCNGNCCYGVVTRTAGSCNDNPPPCVMD